MSGVSQMLPFVIGGGIMIALAFLIDGALGVPNESLGNLGSYHELASMFMKIGGSAFGLMLPVKRLLHRIFCPHGCRYGRRIRPV